MKDGTISDIQVKGIVHNLSRNEMSDGLCEDIVNIRFKDGSWQPSSDGRKVFSMKNHSSIPSVDREYSHLFIHANVYHHVLGVYNGTLYWFANIDYSTNADGVFKPFKTNTDGLPTDAIAITPVSINATNSNFYICQTGHLLTIIDDNGGFEYALFSEKTGEYKILNVDENGSKYSKSLFPYGGVHFNLDTTDYGLDERKIGEEDPHSVVITSEGGYVKADAEDDINHNDTSDQYDKPDVFHADMLKAFTKADEKNIFTRPFLVMIAIKLYDGSYTLASPSTFLFPYQRYAMNDVKIDLSATRENIKPDVPINNPYVAYMDKSQELGKEERSAFIDTNDNITHFNYGDFRMPSYTSYAYGNDEIHPFGHAKRKGSDIYTKVRGADLLLNIEDISIIQENKDLFTGIGIFITPQVYYVNTDEFGSVCSTSKTYRNGTKWEKKRNICYMNFSYAPKRRTIEEIKYDLTHSPFYLLRDYSIDELESLKGEIKVDLSDPKYNGVVKNITAQTRFTSEATERKSYIPKVAYSYNQRLHIANYISSMFYGYPYACITKNNYNGIFDDGSNDFGLHNFKFQGKEKSYINIGGTQKQINKYPYFPDGLTTQQISSALNAVKNFVCIKVHINTDEGASVSRFVKSNITPYGSENDDKYCYDLPPMLSYPDSRADKIDILITTIAWVNNVLKVVQYRTKESIKLTPHPYLNIAYYASADGKPISITGDLFETQSKSLATESSDIWATDGAYWDEVNASETQPNCMKVSSTENPFIFPYENTYQIGSTEIMALCSNAIAVGTGQTGSSPLYVFCKDGIYGCFVDASGKMVYPNARVLARDVINQFNRAVPIDKGVVFTTDRGLMVISGQKVDEIGILAEGEYAKYNDSTAVEYMKIAHNAYINNQLANLAPSSLNASEFKQYLKGAIVNYNHNEFELMVSNPSYNYTWVMDKYGNWTRRDYKAKQYINNYPTSYRLGNDGLLYQVDKDSDGDNGVFLMTNVIKLNTLGFKQLKRVIARGFFKQNQHSTTGSTYIGKSLDSSNEYDISGSLDDLSVTDDELTYTYNIDGELLDVETFTTSSNKENTLRLSFDGQNMLFQCGELISQVWHQECIIDNSKKSDVHIAFVLSMPNGTDVWKKEFHSIPLRSNEDNGLEIDIPAFDETINLLPNHTYTLKLVVYDSVIYLKSIYGMEGSLNKGVMVLGAKLDGSLNGTDIINPATRIIDHSDTGVLVGIGSAGQTVSNLINQVVPLTLNVEDSTNLNDALELLSNGYIHVKGDSLFELGITGEQPLVVKLHCKSDIDLEQNSFVNVETGETFYTTKKPTAGLYLVSQNGNTKYLLAESYNDVVYHNDTSETPNDDYFEWKFDNFTYYGWLEEGNYRLEFRTYVCFEFEDHPSPTHKLSFEHNSGDVPISMSLRVTAYYNNNGELDESDETHIVVQNANWVETEESESSSSSSESESESELSGEEMEIEIPVDDVEDIVDGTTIIGKKYHIQTELPMPISVISGDGITRANINGFIIPETYRYIRCSDDTGDASGFFVGIQSKDTMLDHSKRSKMINNSAAPTKFNSCIFKILNGNGDVVYQSELKTQRAYTEYGCGIHELDRAGESYGTQQTPVANWESIANPQDPYLIACIPFAFEDYLILEPGRYKCVLDIDAEVSIKSLDDYSKGYNNNGKGLFLVSYDEDWSGSYSGYNKGYIDTVNEKFSQVPEEDDTDYAVTIDSIDELEATHNVYTPAHWQDGTTQNYQSHLGLYVFGSYDGRKWALLGGNERQGTYNDIGALVERSDCKYFRIVLAGQMEKESRLDYIEVCGTGSMLSGKPR